jgi:thiamine pyridinylase
MLRLTVVGWLAIEIIAGSAAAWGAEPMCSQAPATRRPLVVSLYPIIPDVKGAAWMIEEAFEKKCPQIDLQISFAPKYYDHRPGKGGIIDQIADVYELDSVFLADFVENKKIQAVVPTAATMIPFASAAAYKGETYGIPHWVCGNFLMYRPNDTGLQGARTLSDVERALGSSPADGSLLIDLKGTSTLGEMYLDGLMDRYKTAAVALQHLNAQDPDKDVLDAMRRTLKLSQSSFGRDEDYHYRAGFYGRQFARGNGRALVGYSELLYYALTEASQSCRHEEKKCLDPAPEKHTSEIAVAEWPLSDAGSQPIGWVDLFVVSAAAKGQLLDDARAFINFMVDNETYRMLLVPDKNLGEVPRYLLPAREDVYADPKIREAAPLYDSFRKAIGSAIPVSDLKLNERLRKVGSDLDGILPANN